MSQLEVKIPAISGLRLQLHLERLKKEPPQYCPRVLPVTQRERERHPHFILQKDAEVSAAHCSLTHTYLPFSRPCFKRCSLFLTQCAMTKLKPDSSWQLFPSGINGQFCFLPIICRCQVPYFLDRLCQTDPDFFGLFSQCSDSRIFPSIRSLNFGLNRPKGEALEGELVGHLSEMLGNAFRTVRSPVCSMQEQD